MINFFYETRFTLKDEIKISKWIESVIKTEGFILGEINYVFCDDEYLLRLNKEFLKHDTLTDIISFDSSNGDQIQGDIYISVERVLENARCFHVEFVGELQRVVIHGVLHFCGYKDKLTSDTRIMRDKENIYLDLFKNI